MIEVWGTFDEDVDVDEVLAAVPKDKELSLYAWVEKDGEKEEDEENTFVGTLEDIETVWDEDSRELWARVFAFACGGKLSKLAHMLKADHYEVEYTSPDSQI